MRGLSKHPLRVLGRMLWLGGAMALAALDFLACVLLRPGRLTPHSRARWLQRNSRRVLAVFGVELIATGQAPGEGLLVSNHLSYLDILVLSALTPAVFIAKREVRNWPILGWFARMAGTLFADREQRSQVGHLNDAIRAVLDQGTLVILFPEGTSSDGRTVLPFKSSLFAPVVGCAQPVAASSIQYRLEDGDAGEEVCYWKDMTLGPHLVNLLSKRRVQAFVGFAEDRHRGADRKSLARLLHSEVLRLKQEQAKHPVAGGQVQIDELQPCNAG